MVPYQKIFQIPFRFWSSQQQKPYPSIRIEIHKKFRFDCIVYTRYVQKIGSYSIFIIE